MEELRAGSLPVELTAIDVANLASINAAVGDVEARFGRLDILANNAGIASGLAPTSEVTLDDLRQTYETNVSGWSP